MQGQPEPSQAQQPSSKKDILRSLEDYSDVALWVNDIMDEDAEEGADHIRELSELERRVSHLSVIVEVTCEDASTQLEKIIAEVSRAVPRLTYDLQLMQESALSLEGTLQAVDRHSSSFLNTQEMSPILEQLNYLDTVKRNMEASLAVLREAESWSSLESDVLSFLVEQEYFKAASRLSETSKSLSVFQNTPEYETRKKLMVSLQNQLEAALSSALISGINNNDVESCKKYFDIFCHIEREAEFRSYWNGSKRKGLVTSWQEAELRDCEPAVTEIDRARKKFASFLADFFQDMLSVLNKERLSVAAIFPDPQITLSTFIANTFSSLSPSPSQRLNALADFYGDLALPELIASFKTTEQFATATNKIMEKVGISSISQAAPLPSEDDHGATSSMQRSLTRRRSARQSFSRRLNRSSISGTSHGILSGSSTLDHSWEEALFEPFMDYLCDYLTLERRFLRAQLRNLLKLSESTCDARMLRERTVDVLGFADEALARCMSFTHGYGAVGLLQSLDDLFEAFLELARQEIVQSSTASTAHVSSITPGEEFAEMDYSAEDLGQFQNILHVLDVVRHILERISAFESRLRATLHQISGTVKMTRNDPLGLYITGTTRTVLSLLQGSALNSMELQTLLDSIESEHQLAQPLTSLTPASASILSYKVPTESCAGLLPRTKQAITDMAKTCQVRIQEIVLAPLIKHLSSYPSLPVWSLELPRERRTGGGGGGGGGVSEVVVPTFSLSPSHSIQRVAEGLLSLPRLFEVYADDDALSFSIETLPFVNEENLKAMVADVSSSTAEVSETTNEQGPRQRPKYSHSPSLSIRVLPPTHGLSAPHTLVLTPEAVSSAWLASLTLTFLSHLTNVVLPSIQRLSTSSAAQLAEDLAYLSQIAKALNAEWQTLELWREAIGLDEVEVRRRIRSDSGELEEKAGMTDVLGIVARLRGWVM